VDLRRLAVAPHAVVADAPSTSDHAGLYAVNQVKALGHLTQGRARWGDGAAPLANIVRLLQGLGAEREQCARLVHVSAHERVGRPWPTAHAHTAYRSPVDVRWGEGVCAGADEAAGGAAARGS
jgi:hypothetical protein